MSLVTEERRSHKNTNLGTRARKVRTEHDNPRGGIRELLSTGLEAILKELKVTTSTIAALLVLDFILYNERFITERDRLCEGCRDSVVSSLAFCHQTTVTVNDRDRRLLDLPFADVAKGFTADRSLLSCL
jgi:hypothetical protein